MKRSIRPFFFFLLPIINSLFSAQNLTDPQNFDSQSQLEAPLLGRIPIDDKRYPTMKYALFLMSETKAKTIVETGTARDGDKNCLGDGCSTLIWGQWAQEHDAVVYSVDINPQAINTAITSCSCYLSNIILTCSDSVTFLNQFSKPVDFLYLDSYDYDFNDPKPSQKHHLKEIIAAYPLLTKKSIVMVDDCDLPGGGKGGLVINYLLERGWKIVAQGYQVIMMQE